MLISPNNQPKTYSKIMGLTDSAWARFLAQVSAHDKNPNSHNLVFTDYGIRLYESLAASLDHSQPLAYEVLSADQTITGKPLIVEFAEDELIVEQREYVYLSD